MESDLQTTAKDGHPIFAIEFIDQFREVIWEYYHRQGRIQPWRNHPDPYHIFVSEVMLQQTRVPRVIEKYPSFVERFPDFYTLAGSELSAILQEWQGLGYNRRARYLKLSAIKITEEYSGILPSDEAVLVTFPGIGRATAASVVAFAFNKPVIFIETNIRRVFIHFFFPCNVIVRDDEILPLVAKALDPKNPREWYYALMDYGTMLAKSGKNPNRRSRHYTRQSSFFGSDRQVRGEIIRFLLLNQPVPADVVIAHITTDRERAEKIIRGMERDGIITTVRGIMRIT
ncbi:MAG: A/G-specific adenine glycosylase [Methanospirillaceae archaeon]|nr:A/G-specific adenine glycosylase [Methanospirillaceae archaeon]